MGAECGFSAGVVVPVGDLSGVHGAVSAAVTTAHQMGISEPGVAAVSLVATELANNLARHAYDGVLIVNGARQPAPLVQLLAIDRGPGIPDLAAALTDGFSTTGTLGDGLGACRRASGEFDLHSNEQGTVVLARMGPGAVTADGGVAARSELAVGGLVTPHPDEQVSGDGWRVLSDESTVTVAMVDGLGHGPGAAAARLGALTALHGDVDPAANLEHAERALAGTRGAVLAVTRIDSARTLEFVGVGNISAVLLRSDAGVRTLLSKPGIVGAGYRHRRLLGRHASMLPGTTLVLHSDGLSTRWIDRPWLPALLGHHPALIAGVLWRDARRTNDDAGICVVAAPPPDQPRHQDRPGQPGQPVSSWGSAPSP
jgi:anti-sigma regulatory factor (Ser/Thr protein kinase)